VVACGTNRRGVCGTQAVGMEFRALYRVALRAGASMASRLTEVLTAGTVIKVIEEQGLASGQKRIRCERGWLSFATSDGRTLVGPVSVEVRTVQVSRASVHTTHAGSAPRVNRAALTRLYDGMVNSLGARCLSHP
jgi:hypothetical protein